jgi:hypothetical protein
MPKVMAGWKLCPGCSRTSKLCLRLQSLELIRNGNIRDRKKKRRKIEAPGKGGDNQGNW